MGQSQKKHLLRPIHELLKNLTIQNRIFLPRGKSKFYVKCDCRLFNWYKIYKLAIAANIDIRISFKYLIEFKKENAPG